MFAQVFRQNFPDGSFARLSLSVQALFTFLLRLMKRTAIFLGAGSSKAFGLPLTSEVFPLMMAGLRDGTLFRGNEVEQAELYAFLRRMLPGLERLAPGHYPMITDILSMIDHALINGHVLWYRGKGRGLEYYRMLLEKAIFEAVGKKLAEKPEVLTRFIGWLLDHFDDTYFSIISTNYDIVVEQELYDHFRRQQREIPQVVDFGVQWRDVGINRVNLRPHQAHLSIFKLHGSTNWLKCQLCNHIYINTYGSIYHQAFRHDIDDHNSCDCGNAPLNSLIVAPSLAREISDNNLPQIWDNAFEQLRVADEWIIIGYSIPPEDLNIKSIFMRAYNGRPQKPKITVVQRGEQVRPRYDVMFDELEYLSGGIEEFVSRLH